jgi:hypothetical protein
MQALLGKITAVEPAEAQAASSDPYSRLRVRFKAACVLPRRSAAPEWLKDQALTVERSVLDAREVGRPGDSLVLTPAESSSWLQPLSVTPSVAYGALPQTLRFELRWWSDLSKLPEWTARAGGRQVTGSFTAEQGRGVASLETRSLFDAEPRLPVTIELSCDKVKALCTVLPTSQPFAGRVPAPEGELHRLENAWYAVNVSARAGGAIAGLREQGRGVDHFRTPEDLIQEEFHNGVYTDRMRVGRGWGWSEQMEEATLTCAGTRVAGETARLSLEGVVDEGQNLRTSAIYTLFDRLPLLLLEREYRFGKGKEKEEEGKGKPGKPKEPIDDMKSVGLGFRCATPVERNGRTGSRILCLDRDQLVVTRCSKIAEFVEYYHWRMSDGWILAEHPQRGEVMLYLSDPRSPAHLATWYGPLAMTVEPSWPMLPARLEEAVGYALALAAGEQGGADTAGAWIACRAPLPDGGVRCAVVGRLRDGAGAQAAVTLGGERRDVSPASLLLPGVGQIQYAVVEFPHGRMDLPLEVTVAGIPGRRA